MPSSSPDSHAPCTTPARTAARVPPPKSCSMGKAKGLRQVRRQIIFQRLNWYNPAIVSVKPARNGSHRESPAAPESRRNTSKAASGSRPAADQASR
jgi:hypothetical protein